MVGSSVRFLNRNTCLCDRNRNRSRSHHEIDAVRMVVPVGRRIENHRQRHRNCGRCVSRRRHHRGRLRDVYTISLQSHRTEKIDRTGCTRDRSRNPKSLACRQLNRWSCEVDGCLSSKCGPIDRGRSVCTDRSRIRPLCLRHSGERKLGLLNDASTTHGSLSFRALCPTSTTKFQICDRTWNQWRRKFTQAEVND